MKDLSFIYGLLHDDRQSSTIIHVSISTLILGCISLCVALEYGKGHLGLHSSHHLTVGYIPACFNIS